eukprot:1658551-Prymnesium_polylepis.2
MEPAGARDAMPLFPWTTDPPAKQARGAVEGLAALGPHAASRDAAADQWAARMAEGRQPPPTAMDGAGRGVDGRRVVVDGRGCRRRRLLGESGVDQSGRSGVAVAVADSTRLS